MLNLVATRNSSLKMGVHPKPQTTKEYITIKISLFLVFVLKLAIMFIISGPSEAICKCCGHDIEI